MTNADKYLKDGVDVYELIRDMTEFYMSGYSYNDNLTYFFNHKVKPTLSEDEKVILRNIKGLKEIYRSTNEDGDLGVTCEICNGYIAKYWINAFNHLFQFIKPRRRI